MYFTLIIEYPLQIRVLLLSSHSLDSSLPPVASEQIFLDHIFQARYFHTDPCAQNHCNVIQSHFLRNPREFLRHLIDLALDCNATVPQLVAFCQALGFRDQLVITLIIVSFRNWFLLELASSCALQLLLCLFIFPKKNKCSGCCRKVGLVITKT